VRLPSIIKDRALGELCWFGVGGPADYYSEAGTVEEACALVQWARERDVPLRVLGEGANVIVRDEGVRGMVIRLTGPCLTSTVIRGNRLEAGAGVKLSRALACAVHAGLEGLEMLSGIPASIGGAVRCNAGGREGDIGQWVCHVEALDRNGKGVELDRSEIRFSYRESSLADLVLTRVVFELRPGDRQQARRRMAKAIASKKASQPLGAASGGCVFRNVRNISSRILIERSGLAGMRIGRAAISPLHANFIVAEPGATASDVLQLIEHVKSTVRDRMHIDMPLEVEIW